MAPKNHEPCGQCGRPAVVDCADVPLCVDCFHKYEVARTLAFRILAIGFNQAAAEMDYFSPYGPPSPKMQIPDIPKGPITLTNINVSNSTVGAINTGVVRKIDVSITLLQQAGSEDLSRALTTLAESIANNANLEKPARDEALDQVAFLSEQAVAGAQERRPGMIKAAIGAVSQIAVTTSQVGSAWQVAEPLLRAIFGL